MVLSLILRMYASTLCELFGCPTSAMARAMRKAEATQELAHVNMQDATI